MSVCRGWKLLVELLSACVKKEVVEQGWLRVEVDLRERSRYDSTENERERERESANYCLREHRTLLSDVRFDYR